MHMSLSHAYFSSKLERYKPQRVTSLAVRWTSGYFYREESRIYLKAARAIVRYSRIYYSGVRGVTEPRPFWVPFYFWGEHVPYPAYGLLRSMNPLFEIMDPLLY